MAGLTPAQVASYDNDGYVVLPSLFTAAELQGWNEEFLDLVEARKPLSPDMKVMKDVMVVKGAVEAATAVHAVNKVLCLENNRRLFSFVEHPALLAAIGSLLGDDLYSLASNVFNKPPGVDGRHPLHQDLRYFKMEPAEGIVGVWTAMLPALRKTGCLAVIPGSHTQGMLPHSLPEWEYVNHGFYAVSDVDLDARVHVELQPGDTLLFHPLLVHGSGRNRSDEFRRAISVHYAAGSCVSVKGDWKTNPFTRHVGTP